jgi:hypothetical protein
LKAESRIRKWRNEYIQKCVEKNKQRMNQIEEIVVNQHMIAHSSLNDYVRQVNPPLKHQIISWSLAILLWLTFDYMMIMMISNDPQVSNTQIFIILMYLFVFSHLTPCLCSHYLFHLWEKSSFRISQFIWVHAKSIER